MNLADTERLRIVEYVCPTCHAVKELHVRWGTQTVVDVPCGVQGCTDRAIPRGKS